MTSAPFRIELLRDHDRADFDCGIGPLNDYFRTQVRQDTQRRVSFCYVAIDCAMNELAGYYSLSATGVALTELPSVITKRLPRYPTIPAVLISRLAVDLRYRGRKLGGVFLSDAIARTIRSGIAAYAVIVDAKDEAAVSFYEHYGFQRFHDLARRLFLPISDALKRLALGDADASHR